MAHELHSRWSAFEAISNRSGSSPVIKEAIAVSRVTAKALGYTRDKRALTKGIEAFMMSTGVFEVLVAAIETIGVILHAIGFCSGGPTPMEAPSTSPTTRESMVSICNKCSKSTTPTCNYAYFNAITEACTYSSSVCSSKVSRPHTKIRLFKLRGSQR